MMLFTSLLLLFAVAVVGATPVGSPDAVPFVCGNPPPTKEYLAQIAGAAATEEMAGNFTDQAVLSIKTRVFFHIVAESKTNAGGWVSNGRLDKQFNVLKTEYAKHGIHLILAGTTRTINAGWANSQDEEGMVKKLRKGTYKDLNIYIQKTLGDAAGYCTGPTGVGGPGSYNGDGCHVVADSLPGGGPYNGFNDGKAAIHEVGHWYGLLHTFDGGCEGAGDHIADTPAEKEPPNEPCPTGRNSCPGQKGKDPIHNHMDYTSGQCKTHFTKGQQRRMHTQWNTYRKGH